MNKQVAKVEPQDDTVFLPADPMVAMIERVVMDPDIDMGKLEKLLDMRERMEAAQAKKDFAAAFSRASVSFPTVPLNGKGHNNKPYALLKDIIGYTREALSENGLALSFGIETGERIIVTAELMHRSGHSKTTSITLPSDTSGSKNAVQAIGSTQTYGQRYTAQAILGLSLGDDIDDDGKGHGSQPVEKMPTWAQTIVQELPPAATERDKAEAIADAICAQWKRKKSEGEINNEWDRRNALIEAMRDKHSDLFHKVTTAFDERMAEIQEAKADAERLPV